MSFNSNSIHLFFLNDFRKAKQEEKNVVSFTLPKPENKEKSFDIDAVLQVIFHRPFINSLIFLFSEYWRASPRANKEEEEKGKAKK